MCEILGPAILLCEARDENYSWLWGSLSSGLCTISWWMKVGIQPNLGGNYIGVHMH